MIRIEGIPIVAARLAAARRSAKLTETPPRSIRHGSGNEYFPLPPQPSRDTMQGLVQPRCAVGSRADRHQDLDGCFVSLPLEA
jgi:hypothetical protein